ncbi:MAG: hypothetical protein Q8P41_18130 [Pseudomonadota bacterium]|nr:hypothetical protein [Pseudomonadota bacterium]
MRLPSLLSLGLLSACVAPDDTDKPDVREDTDTVPDDTDTGDTGDTGDTAPPAPSAHRWGGSSDAADLTVGYCGTDDNGAHVLAPGPDLDGDGLGELAIGVAGHDGGWAGSGGVYVFAGSAVADGVRTRDATTRITPPAEDSGTGVGTRVEWVGDRDGDGLDDLLVIDLQGRAYSVSGADVLAGGEVAPRALLLTRRIELTRWADVDADGRADWLFAFIDESPSGAYEGQGAVSLVLDTDFTLEGIARSTTAYGSENRSAAGTALISLHGDRDGDGLPEFAVSMYDEVHVIGSAAFLAGGRWLIDEALTTAHYLGGHQVLAPGDTDGDGLDELLVFQGGNKLCVLDGADLDGDERVCIRDAGLGPGAGAVLGDDLDHDGVPDLWFTRDGYLVAQDVRALAEGIELELVRVPLPETLYGLSDGDGVVWGNTAPAMGGGAEVDVAYAYTASLSPQREMTIRGGAWGGLPGEPTWRDVTGDGVVDLALHNDTYNSIATFDGATLADGGSYTWCDATWTKAWAGATTYWIDDVDGDGADDALVLTLQDDGTYLHEVWPGPAVIGLAEGAPMATWTDDRDTTPMVDCDVDGDGLDDLRRQTGVGWAILGGALGEDGTFPRIGAVQGSLSMSCLPDIDGDGRDELYTLDDGVYRLYRYAQLDPSRTLRLEEAWVTLGGNDWAGPEPLHDPDGRGGLVGWWLEVGGDYQLCLLDLSTVSGEVLSTDVPMTCLPGLYPFYTVTGWLDAVVGDAAPDLVLYGRNIDREYGVRVIDGTLRGDAALLVSTGVEPPTRVGPGADTLGVGARGIWARTEEAAWPGRYRIDVVYARAEDETSP